MTKTELRNTLAAMHEEAAKPPHKDVKRFFRAPSGARIEIVARANRIGFVRWDFNGDPCRKAKIEWMLEMTTPE